VLVSERGQDVSHGVTSLENGGRVGPKIIPLGSELTQHIWIISGWVVHRVCGVKDVRRVGTTVGWIAVEC
jgi:hypothetical protein